MNGASELGCETLLLRNLRQSPDQPRDGRCYDGRPQVASLTLPISLLRVNPIYNVPLKDSYHYGT